MNGKAESQRSFLLLLLRQRAVLARAQRISRHSQEAMRRLIHCPNSVADSDRPMNNRN